MEFLLPIFYYELQKQLKEYNIIINNKMRSLISKSVFIGVAANVIAPRRVYACSLPNSKDLEEKFSELNKQSVKKELENVKNDLSNWKEIQVYRDYIEESTNLDLFNELCYIYTMYERPLKPYQRVHTRNKLLKLFNESKSQEEKKLIYTVIEYYGLLNE